MSQNTNSNNKNSLAVKLKIGDLLFFQNFIEAPEKLFSKPETEEYFDLIDYMLADYEIETALETRKSAVLKFPHGLEGDKEAIKQVEKALEDINFEQDLKSFLDFLAYGSYYFIVNWKEENGFYKIASIDPAHPRYFKWDEKGRLYYQSGNTYKKIPEYRIIYFRRNPTPDNPYGESILKACYPMWRLKYETINQLFAYQDKFANPPVAGIKKEGDLTEEKAQKVAEDLAQLQSGSSAFFQGIDDIKTITPGTGSAEFWNTIRNCDLAISKAITKQTLTTNASDQGKGSYALGKVHQETLEMIAIYDALYLQKKLNITLIKWIKEINNIKGRCEFKFNIPDEADLEDIFKAIDKGLPIPEDYLYQRLKIPKPKPSDKIITSIKQPLMMSDAGGEDDLNFF